MVTKLFFSTLAIALGFSANPVQAEGVADVKAAAVQTNAPNPSAGLQTVQGVHIGQCQCTPCRCYPACECSSESHEKARD